MPLSNLIENLHELIPGKYVKYNASSTLSFCSLSPLNNKSVRDENVTQTVKQLNGHTWAIKQLQDP
jgi:hypothetical protein